MKLRTITPLTEAIPNETIFTYMTSLSFIPDSTVAQYLDLEYFVNRSGQKQASPLVERLTEDTEKLANVILARYRVKWESLFRQYSDLSTLNLLSNINVTKAISHGEKVVSSGSETLSKTGTEETSHSGSEIRTESFDGATPRKSTRTISGKYTDITSGNSIRSGLEETTESFPETRVSAKVTSGGYSDTDTTTSTRTGSQITTDKGATTTAVFGFNSTSAVKTNTVGPENAELGTTTELTYGDSGLIDAHSGGVSRAYNPDTGLREETSESGQRKLSTTYGENGLKDEESSTTERTYDGYKDELTETGQKTTTTSFGPDGRKETLSFNNRSDNKSTSDTITHSGTDETTEKGYRYNSLVEEYITLFLSADYLDFLEIVFTDCDEVLTLPYYV